MQYDLIDLRLFVHVVTEGSITAGAQRMHLSLPSASARIRALERHSGMGLLVRGRRGVRPTPAGSALARHAREVLTQTARLDGAVAGYRRSSDTPVALLAGSSAMHHLVPGALITFLREHPERDVTVVERQSAQIVGVLADGGADLGIVIEAVLDSGPRGAELTSEFLCDDSLVAIGPAGGVLAGRTTLTYREVAEHPLVGLEPDAPLQRTLDAGQDASAPVPRYRTRVGNLHTLIALVAAGVGLGVVPRRALEPTGALEIAELHDAWSRRQLMLCWGVAAQHSEPATAALAEHLRLAAAC